jgi:hypothetical protein
MEGSHKTHGGSCPLNTEGLICKEVPARQKTLNPEQHDGRFDIRAGEELEHSLDTKSHGTRQCWTEWAALRPIGSIEEHPAGGQKGGLEVWRYLISQSPYFDAAYFKASHAKRMTSPSEGST